MVSVKAVFGIGNVAAVVVKITSANRHTNVAVIPSQQQQHRQAVMGTGNVIAAVVNITSVNRHTNATAIPTQQHHRQHREDVMGTGNVIVVVVKITSANHHTYATAIPTQHKNLEVFLFAYFVFLDYNFSRQLGLILDLRKPPKTV